MFNNIDPQGNPTAPIVNQLVNFGWEYVYHCHILSHEEMDMMRPVSVAMPPVKPDWPRCFGQPDRQHHDGDLSWNDNSIAETSYVVQRNERGWHLGRRRDDPVAAQRARTPHGSLRTFDRPDVRSCTRRTSTGSSPRTRSATWRRPGGFAEHDGPVGV